MQSSSPQRSVGQRLAQLARLAIAATLLFVLFVKIPWHDRVVLTTSDGTERELSVAPPTIETSGEPVILSARDDARWRFELAGEGSSLRCVMTPSNEADAVWHDASGVYQPGLGGSLRRLSIPSFLIASLLALAGTVTATTRWKVLLGAAGVRIPLLRALRLNLAGLAASQVLLGSVGGDLVKGALVTRDASVPAELAARTNALMALVMDRIVGLVALLSIGTAAAFLVEGQPGELASWFAVALGVLLTGVVGVLVAAGRFDFPARKNVVWRILHSVHEALVAYSRRPGALLAGLLLSFASHSFLISAIAHLGTSLGMQVGPLQFFLLIPIVETAQAVPISPAGWGVAESMYVVLFRDAGETATLALSLALSVRAVTLSQALLGVPGLVLLLRRRNAIAMPSAATPLTSER